MNVWRPGQRVLTIGQMGAVDVIGGRGQVAVGWWLAGGINPAACIAAYQPKGAASLAASYTNLASPGTYNAAPGTPPAFDPAAGWGFNAPSSQWLTTGITAIANTYSIIARYAGMTAGSVIGAVAAPYSLGIRTPYASNAVLYYGASQVNRASAAATGRVALRGVGDGTGQFYLNGVAVGAAFGAWAVNCGPIYLGCLNFGGSPLMFMTGNLLAAAVYSSISEVQLQAVDAEIAAL